MAPPLSCMRQRQHTSIFSRQDPHDPRGRNWKENRNVRAQARHSQSAATLLVQAL